MTAFTFNNAIPASGNNPSNDQPDMLQNNISEQLIWAVDHVTFNSVGNGGGGPGASGGQHLQVTYNSKNVPAVLPVDPISISFIGNASAPTGVLVGLPKVSATTNAQEFFSNQNGTFLTSAIRAFGIFTPSGIVGAQTVLNGFNIASVSLDVTKLIYTITLVVGATNGTNFVPIVTFGSNLLIGIGTYNITTAGNIILITFSNIPLSTANISIAVLQV